MSKKLDNQIGNRVKSYGGKPERMAQGKQMDGSVKDWMKDGKRIPNGYQTDDKRIMAEKQIIT